MRRFIAPVITVVLVVVAYNPIAEWVGKYLPFAGEDKLTAAFPLSIHGRSKIERIREISGTKLEAINSQLRIRLKLRALTCSSAHLPRWYQSIDTVRNTFSNPECFARQEEQITDWMGLIEVGLVLKQPPLRLMPANAASVIQADDFIHEVTFADRAPIGLLNTRKSLQVMDLGTGRSIFSMPYSRIQSFSKLSPNGRLFAESQNDILSVRGSESGEVLLKFPDVAGYEFFWLDDRTAAYKKGYSKINFIDFENATVAVGDVGEVDPSSIVVPGKSDHYVILGRRHPVEVELVRSAQMLRVNVVGSKGSIGSEELRISTARNTGGPSVDGKAYISAVNNLSLFLVDALEESVVEMQPFEPVDAMPTPDQNKVLLVGRLELSQPQDHDYFFYDIQARTIAPVTQISLPKDRVEYAYPLNKFAVIRESRLFLLDQLLAGDEMPLQEWRAEQLLLVAARKRDRTNTYGSSKLGIHLESSVRSAPRAQSLLHQLYRGAQVEGIGVYEAANGFHNVNERRAGDIEIEVRRSARPLVIVLTSYEPVRWKVKQESGANIRGIILSGYHTSNVEGAGAARVVRAGMGYAYTKESSNYASLNRKIEAMIGKPMDVFQGAYSGKSFSVGGN